MDISLPFSLLLPFVVEIIIAGILLSNFPLNFRFKPYIAIPVGLTIAFIPTIGTALGFYFLYPTYVQWNEVTNSVIYAIPTIAIYFAFFFAFKIDYKSLLLLTAVAYSFQHIAYQTNIIVFDTGLKSMMDNNLDGTTDLVIYYVGSNLIKIGVFTILYFTIARPFKRNINYLFKTASILILTVVGFLMINVVNTIISQHYWWDRSGKGFLAAGLIIFCVTFDILIVNGLYSVSEREKAAIIEANLHYRSGQYEMMQQSLNFINIKLHDIRKEIRRLKANKDSLTDEDFNMIERSISLYDSDVDSGDTNIDMLIQDRIIYCKSVGIEFTPLVDATALKMIKTVDAYFLLMNIMDNAIDAVSKLEDKEKRIITLVINKKQGATVIEQVNYFTGQIKFEKDGSIKTDKQDNRYHGFGTKSIAYIVKKYNGTIAHDIEKDIFTLKIVL